REAPLPRHRSRPGRAPRRAESVGPELPAPRIAGRRRNRVAAPRRPGEDALSRAARDGGHGAEGAGPGRRAGRRRGRHRPHHISPTQGEETMNQKTAMAMWDHIRQINGVTLRLIDALPAEQLDAHPIPNMRTPKELVV